MEFSLTTLGTASALPTANRYPSAHILTVRERLFLIDCGEGTQMQLRKYGLSVSKIDNIFISHLHGDHLFGLFGLLSSLSLMGRTAPLYLFAPYRMAEIIEFFKVQFCEDIKYEIIHRPVKCSAPKQILDLNNLEVFAFPLNHRCEAYGYLFKEKTPQLNIHKHLVEAYKLSLYEIARLKEGSEVVRIKRVDENGDISTLFSGVSFDGELEEGCYKEMLSPEEFTYLPYKSRSFAYCSDTAPFPELSSWIKGVDLLYHEATFGKDDQKVAESTAHSTTLDAARCASEAGAGKLVIGHYSSRYKNPELLVEEAKMLFKNSFSAKEGTKYEVPLEKFNF